VGSSTYYGPGNLDGTFGGELTVTCPDGSEIGESWEHDMSGFRGTADELMPWLEDALEDEVKALCDQCPKETEPPNVV
jgi:hypothetical protein